ncbi:MAG TPA: hydrogenase nickel incorporation protein HypB [Actinomycetota bacterium]|nr:hydrogenase nickel incorporation protein HypB [Actinomycetota bacterium]
MCTTCGCSSDEVVVTDPDHRHDHDHDHDEGHVHDHDEGHVHVHDDRSARTLVLEQAVLAKNDLLAQANRSWFAEQRILAINLMSSPGAGKTTLLERTITDLSPELPMAVVEGDQETLLDADRIRATGCRVVQINTGAGCHLDADMVGRGLKVLEPKPSSMLMIENVGNLVCPAMFDLGERAKVVIMSVTEGHDKPLKYPQMFRAADLMVLNKVDLLPYVQFDPEQCITYACQVNPKLDVVSVSATRGDGLDAWYDWLRDQR